MLASGATPAPPQPKRSLAPAPHWAAPGSALTRHEERARNRGPRAAARAALRRDVRGARTDLPPGLAEIGDVAAGSHGVRAVVPRGAQAGRRLRRRVEKPGDRPPPAHAAMFGKSSIDVNPSRVPSEQPMSPLHVVLAQTRLAQSRRARHARPFAHGGHEGPPQSTSVSSPSFVRLVHVAGTSTEPSLPSTALASWPLASPASPTGCARAGGSPASSAGASAHAPMTTTAKMTLATAATVYLERGVRPRASIHCRAVRRYVQRELRQARTTAGRSAWWPPGGGFGRGTSLAIPPRREAARCHVP